MQQGSLHEISIHSSNENWPCACTRLDTAIALPAALTFWQRLVLRYSSMYSSVAVSMPSPPAEATCAWVHAG